MPRRPGTEPSRTEASRAELARAAVATGQSALAAQDTSTAVSWLDRANRLLPADPNVMLSLASACLDSNPGRAATLFRRVADRHDIRHAWLGLAAALLRQAGPAAAADPLGKALSRHAYHRGHGDTGDANRDAAFGTGWCGLASDGTVVVRAPPIGSDRDLARWTALGTALAPGRWSTSHSRIDVARSMAVLRWAALSKSTEFAGSSAAWKPSTAVCPAGPGIRPIPTGR